MRVPILLLLSLAPAANAGIISILSPLRLEIGNGTTSSIVTGAASDLSVATTFQDFAGTGYYGQATLTIPGSFSGGSIDQASPLGFGLSNVFVSCGAHPCTGYLDIDFSFALQIDSGFPELAGQLMTSSVAFAGSQSAFSLPILPAASMRFQGSFTNSLSVASSYVRSFALTGFNAGNASFASNFTNAGVGSFGPSGSLGTLTVDGSLRLSGLDQSQDLELANVDYTFEAPAAVPEPGTLAMVLFGIISCLWFVRRPATPAIALRKSSPRPDGPGSLAAAPVLPGICGESDRAPGLRRS